MSIFLTGGTGFIGSYVVHELLRRTDERLALLVRAKNRRDAEEKLWRALQNHVSGPELFDALERIDFVFGDLTLPRLGTSDATWDHIVRETSSVLHIAASLNRKSAKACFNHNLRGSLSVIKLARAAHDHHGLRRFDHVSTAAVAGIRSHEVLGEDETVDWNRSDYDPYARTKKFVEHMVDELLPDVRRVVYRPTTIMGDARHPRTAAFDMTRAFTVLADLPVVPMDGRARIDVANVDWVARVIAKVFLAREPKHDAYSLSAGVDSNTAEQIANQVNRDLRRRKTRFVPQLSGGFSALIDAMNALPGRNAVTHTGALLKVFWPYITYDTVFDNARAVDAMGGEKPVPFVDYCTPLYRWVKEHRFQYPYAPFPERPVQLNVPAEIQA
jgi:long-chain acyl-CoA synthetase